MHAITEEISRICDEARWFLMSRVATAQGFRLIPTEATTALTDQLGLQRGAMPTHDELAEFRKQLDADLVLVADILDYGKVRWQWLAGGMLVDMTWETAAIGVATGWNPALILGNVGFEVLTSTPMWFGGGHLFGPHLGRCA